MSADQSYVDQVIAQLPQVESLRTQVAMELRSHIAERVEHGDSVEEALRQLGNPIVLAESYLAAIPLVSAPIWPRAAARLIDICGFQALAAPNASASSTPPVSPRPLQCWPSRSRPAR